MVQLFCVARALVRRPRILVLDEATADLDQDSANELLKVIDTSFKEITVISIAHRLNFIKNSDRILVLNAGGTVNAFDTPAKLLEDKEGCESEPPPRLFPSATLDCVTPRSACVSVTCRLLEAACRGEQIDVSIR